MTVLHGFAGHCSPYNEKYTWRHDTFSLGIFPMVPRKGGGYKRGAVIVRVKGWTENPEQVYDKAREVVDALDKGIYKGPKYVDLR